MTADQINEALGDLSFKFCQKTGTVEIFKNGFCVTCGIYEGSLDRPMTGAEFHRNPYYEAS